MQGIQVPITTNPQGLTRLLQNIYQTPATSNILGSSTPVIVDILTDIIISNNTKLEPPTGLTVTPVGTTGSTTYTYWVIAVDAWGNYSPISASAKITNGNAVLSATNYNQVTWNSVPGAVNYIVLVNSTSQAIRTSLSPLSYLIQATGGTTQTFNHQMNGNGAGQFTYPLAAPGNGTLTGTGLVGSGLSYWYAYVLRDGNGNSTGLSNMTNIGFSSSSPGTGIQFTVNVPQTTAGDTSIPVYVDVYGSPSSGSTNLKYVATFNGVAGSSVTCFINQWGSGAAAPAFGSSGTVNLFGSGGAGGYVSTAGFTAPTTNNTGQKIYAVVHKVPNGQQPSSTTKIADGVPVDIGQTLDLQMNVTLNPGDAIYAKIFTDNNFDTVIDNLGTIMINGVEML
jgi:hypothetical protein